MAVIGLDVTHLSLTGKGVSRYQHNIIKNLAKLDKKNCYYIFLNKRYTLPSLPTQENFHYISIYKPMQIIWDQFQLPLLIRKYRLDIFHSTSDTLPLLGRVKFALFLFEIPDYRIELMRRSGRISLYTRLSQSYNRFFFRKSLNKAGIIMASSRSTKTDLIRKYGIEEKKIRVVYPAADEQFCVGTDERDLWNTRRRYNADSGYVLHISTNDPRDNTAAVIRAFKKAQPGLKIPKKLIICGGGSEGMGLKRLVKELNLENDVIFIGYLLPQELAFLYRAADLFIDPSLYEGFGFQVVEAMACGIPVITSNVTSLPEIVGDAGILLFPDDVDGLAAALISVLTDSGLREAMCRKSLERARFFSWEKTAQETLAVYEELKNI